MENKTESRLLFSNDVCSGKGGILHSGKCGLSFNVFSHFEGKLSRLYVHFKEKYPDYMFIKTGSFESVSPLSV